MITQYDREERTIVSPTSLLAAAAHADQLALLGSERDHVQQHERAGLEERANIPTTFQDGWVSLFFNGSSVPAGVHKLVGGTSTLFNTRTGVTSTLATTTFNGLPVVGFDAIVYVNGTLTSGGVNVQSNYGTAFPHKYTQNIQ